MQKNCKKCNLSFEITTEDLEFYKKISPKFWDKIFEIPTPTLCPECRQQRRLAWRNERKLYKRKCDATGEVMISIYSPDKQYKVYSNDFYWSDKWDALDYGKNFDFNKSFFKQFGELLKEAPLVNIHSHLSNINSQYTNYFISSKNCYFCFWWWYCEDVFYSSFPLHCNDSMELFFSFNCENCYNITHSNNCNRLYNSTNCIDCYNGYFLENCVNCKNCIACNWLINKDYCFLNKQLTKQEFNDILEKFKNNTLDKNILKKIKNFNKTNIKLSNILRWSTNSNWWYIISSNNVNNSFNIIDWDNIKHSNILMNNVKDVYDSFGSWVDIELIYETVTASMWINKVLFSSIIRDSCSNIFYSFNISNSSNLFWCVWLKNKEYCIFNKQYTKEEYNKLVPKIIEKIIKDWEWWEFFPANLSPFWYNETVANEYFPLTKEKAQKLGFNWSDYKPPFPKVEKVIPAEKLPEDISKIPDDILNWAIKCEVSWKPFRIIKQELEFYRKHKLSIPKKHPDIRHSERMKLRNPRKLFDRKCDKCWVEIKSTYALDREEIVYCKGCYEDEVY